MDGRLVNQITKGNWAIRASSGPFWLRKAVTGIDEEDGWIYFTALEKSSIERHLYRIRFDGTGMERISREEGTHAVTFSPDTGYYFDRYSNISTLPSLSLHKNDGTRSAVLAEPRTELLAKFDMQYPELTTVPADDGFPLPAQILKPKDFNPQKKYPVVIHVYGGPSAPRVSNSWQFANYLGQILLRIGYLFVQFDNRSATAISKKLETTVVKQLYGDHELRDLLAAVKWLKSQSYVDPDRVGIWGSSGGGCYTLLAMTRSKEFKAGISVAAVTDFYYIDSGVEYVMKLPQDNPEGYEKTALVNYAKDLHGRLLLVHGTYDDNVHIQNTWHFADELISAGKMFDMMIYPMRKHGFRDNPARIHLGNTMIEFWKKHL
jgi:dipeptidyl-peptidase-4